MRAIKTFVLWVLTVFMVVSAIIFFPSVASIIMLAFAVIAAPIEPWQEFLSDVGFYGWLKGIALCAAFIGAMVTAPVNHASRTAESQHMQPTIHGTLPSGTPTQAPTSDVEESVVPDATDAPAATQTTPAAASDVPTLAPAPSEPIPDTPTPAQSHAPVPTSAPATQNPGPAVTPPPTTPPVQQTQASTQPANNTQINGRTVYVTPTGDCWHYNPNCNSRGHYYIPEPGEIERRGLTPCTRCVH